MEVDALRVDLAERGEFAIMPAAAVLGTTLQYALEHLAEKKIIELRITPSAVVVQPREFVGELRQRRAFVRISPKLPRLFHAMQVLARAGRKKAVEAVETVAVYGGEDVVDAREALAVVAEEAVSAGLPFMYQRVERGTSAPRGRIVFGATVRRYACRGVKHRSVCAVPTRRLDPGPCSLIATAGALAMPSLGQSLRSRLDAALEVVAEYASVLPVNDANELAARVQADYNDRPDVVRLARVAEAVLREDTEEWCVTGVAQGASYTFFDADRLWECACFEALRRCAIERPSTTAAFHPQANAGVRLLMGGGPEIDPDMVLSVNSTPTLVLDSKNTISLSAAADDVYQMVAYVERLSASAGLIVYMSSGAPWFEPLGRTVSGATIAAAGASEAIEGDVRRWIVDLLARGREAESAT